MGKESVNRIRLRRACAVVLLLVVVVGAAVGGPNDAAPPTQSAVPPTQSAVPPTQSARPRLPEIPASRYEAKTARQNCLPCHKKLDPGLYDSWSQSPHAMADVTCADCHGLDHSTIFSSEGRVPVSACARCHKKAAAEFATSGHATTFPRLQAAARFRAADELTRSACKRCHGIGRPDLAGGSPGRCQDCHLAHGFLKSDARNPAVCDRCHRSYDHPQAEAYEASKHGIVYRRTQSAQQAPTCASCHMPDGRHGSDETLTIGTVAQGRRIAGDPRQPAPPYPQATISPAAFEAARSAAIARCSQCHSERFATRALEHADELKRTVDRLLAEAGAAIVETYRVEHRGVPPLGPAQPPTGDPLVDGFNDLVMHAAPTAWKGAYHFSPAHAFIEGLAPVQNTHRALLEQARARTARARGDGK